MKGWRFTMRKAFVAITATLFVAFGMTTDASLIFAYDADDTTVGTGPDVGSLPPVWERIIYANPPDVTVFEQSSTGNGDGDANLDGDIDSAGGTSWGLFAGPNGLLGPSHVRLGHTFAGGALSLGQTLFIDMDTGFIDNGGIVGVELDASGFDRFVFQFTGGQTTYQYGNIGNLTDSGIGFTDEGMRLAFTLLTADTIDFRVTTFGDGQQYTFNNLSLGNSGGIERIEIYNIAAGASVAGEKDAFFNNLAVIPEPATASLILAGLLGLAARRRFA